MTKNQSSLIRETFAVGPLACNCSIIGDSISKQGMVFDPGGDAEKIKTRIKKLDLNIVAIICTHAHFDHILAAGEIHKSTQAPIYLNPKDKQLWNALETQCHLFGVNYQPVPYPHLWLNDEDILPCCNGFTLHTPGHSPGSTCFWFEKNKILIAGDTLFKGSVGRTDLWGGDHNQIKKSILERLYTLDEKTIVIPGHGGTTSIEQEKKFNQVIRL